MTTSDTIKTVGDDIGQILNVAAAGFSAAGAVAIGQLLAAFSAAEPAIVSGAVSAEPFIAAGITLIESGGEPDATAWATQIGNLTQQTTTLDDQVAADEAAQPDE